MRHTPSEKRSPLKVVLVRDSNPGHYNQSEGIVDALSRIEDVHVTRVALPKRVAVFDRLARQMLRLNFNRMATWLCRIDFTNLPNNADVIVSAGGATLASNATLARHYGCKNIFSGSIRRFSAVDFTCILHIDPERKNWPRHIVGLKPAPVATVASSIVNAPPKSAVLLLGGPIDDCPLSDEDISMILSTINSSGLRWTILNSRRTPQVWTNAASALASNNANIIFNDHLATAQGALPNVLAQSDAVFVTGDSTSMISEAIGLQRPTISLEPQEGASGRDLAYLKDLEFEGWLIRIKGKFDDWGLFQKSLSKCRPKQKPAVEELAKNLKAALVE